MTRQQGFAHSSAAWRRAGRTAALVLSLLLAVVALPGCSDGRSVAAYCRTFLQEGERFRASYAGTDADSDPVGALVKVLAAPQELALIFKKLQKVAPGEIEDDVEVLQKAFQKIADDAAANGANPVQGVLEAVVLGATTKAPADRVDAYTAANCDPLPGAAAAGSPSPSDTPAPTPTSVPNATPQIGDVVFDDALAQRICGSGTVWNGDGHQTYDLRFVPGRRAAMDCQNSTHQVNVLDLMTGDVLWQADLPEDSQWGVTSAHLFIETTKEVQATGLEDAYNQAELSSYDLTDGTPGWTVPLEDWIAPGDRKDDELKVWEDAADQDVQGLVVVGHQGTTAFDPESGAERWHTKRRYQAIGDPDATNPGSQIYVGASTFVSNGETDEGDVRLEGFDARSGKRRWVVDPPSGAGPYAGGCGEQMALDGTTLWCGRTSSYDTVDVRSGKLLERFSLPKSIEPEPGQCWASPSGVLLYTGSQLKYYTPESGSRPAWTAKASGNIDALGLGHEHLLLSAKSGPVMLSAGDGSQESTSATQGDAGSGEGSRVVDGVAWMQTEFNGLAAVLVDAQS